MVGGLSLQSTKVSSAQIEGESEGQDLTEMRAPDPRPLVL